MRNRFYDLPTEIICQIYIRDSTYKEFYNKVIDVIENNVPKFSHLDENYYVFNKVYHFCKLEDHFRVSQKYSFKKAVFIIIKKISKQNTIFDFC
jgi:hypothetical protein